MSEYPKINAVYMRDKKGRLILGEWAQPEFGYLADLDWLWTEKVDGTNIRLEYTANRSIGSEHLYIKGRTDNAQIPPSLLHNLIELMKAAPFESAFPGSEDQVTLYGEGYGPGIQKGGGLYADTPSFVLFDVKVGDWWLRRADVEDVGVKLGIEVVPVRHIGPIGDAIGMVRGDFEEFVSRWYGARPEGLVGRPLVDLWDRTGNRVTTKIKVKDFINPVTKEQAE